MQTDKIHIEKNSVQETLIVPLYGRKMCAEKYPDLYTDTSAKMLCERLDHDFSALEARKDRFFTNLGRWKRLCGNSISCGRSKIT